MRNPHRLESRRWQTFAQLKTGVWPFIRGKYKSSYDALRQPYEDQAEDLQLERLSVPTTRALSATPSPSGIMAKATYCLIEGPGN